MTKPIHVVFEVFHGKDRCERRFAGILTSIPHTQYKLIEMSSMSLPFSGPPSLSQERIHAVI